MSPARSLCSRAAFAAAVALALLHAAPSMARTVERSIDRNISDGTSNAVPAATATLDCGGGLKITVSDGNQGGHCRTAPNGESVSCSVNNTQVAHATCTGGCVATGQGGCATTQ